MTLTELKNWCRSQLELLDTEGEADSTSAGIVRKLKQHCYDCGLYDFALTLPIERRKYPISAAIQLKRTLAELEIPPDDNSLLDMQQAAAILGYQVSGLRRIVRQGRIQYLQNGQGPIKFKREWLEDFANSLIATTTENQQKQPQGITEAVYGFDPNLYR